MIVAEIYKGGKHLEGVRKMIFEKHLAANMNLLTLDEHRELFTNAGFFNVQIFEELDKGWICGVGKSREAVSVSRGLTSQSTTVSGLSLTSKFAKPRSYAGGVL